MDAILNEWSDIQNIVVSKEFNRKYLRPAFKVGISDIPDPCSKHETSDCPSPHCEIYNDLCVATDRIGNMHETNNMLKSVVHNIPFRVLNQFFIAALDDKYNTEMYCVMVESLHTNNIYVLFNEGRVLHSGILYKQVGYVEYANNYIGSTPLYYNWIFHSKIMTIVMDIVNQIRNNDKKCIIAGHSMGDVVAMYTGWQLYMHNSRLFGKQCVVIGTGGGKWMNVANFPNQLDYAALPNVHHFVSGTENVAQKNQILVDCYYDTWDERQDAADTLQYFPTAKLLYKTLDAGVKLIDSWNYQRQIGDYTIVSAPGKQCTKLHSWNFYKDLLQKMYGKSVVPIDRVKMVVKHTRSQGRKTRSRKTRSRKTRSRKTRSQ